MSGREFCSYILLEAYDDSKKRSTYMWKAGVTGAERRLEIFSQQRYLLVRHDN